MQLFPCWKLQAALTCILASLRLLSHRLCCCCQGKPCRGGRAICALRWAKSCPWPAILSSTAFLHGCSICESSLDMSHSQTSQNGGASGQAADWQTLRASTVSLTVAACLAGLKVWGGNHKPALQDT